MVLKLENATLEDLNELVFIEKSCFDESKYHLMKKSNFKHLLMKGNALIKLAFLNNICCGMYVSFLRKNSVYARLYSIAVLPEHQGKDLGKKLYEDLVQESKERGLKGILLEIREDNFYHKERYLKLGFKVTKTLDNYYPDKSSGTKLKLDFN